MMDDTRQAHRQALGPTGRWWWAVAGGLLVASPLAWLLSHGALLPFFLGLFFFVLFGLVIGAVMHRVAVPGRPYPRGTVLAGTTVVVLATWFASIMLESRDFPFQQAKELSRNPRLKLGGQTVEQYRITTAEAIRAFLRDRYAPGGTIGYVRWIVTSGRLPPGTVSEIRRSIPVPQRRFVWLVRAALSIALLAFGVGSQTFPLRLASEPAVRAMDEKPPTPKSVQA